MFGLSAAAVGGIAAGAGAIGGAVIASNGAKSAAQTQANAAQDANATNLQMFNTQVGLNAPFRETGLSANNRLAFLLGLTPGQGDTTAGAPQTLTQGSDGVFSPTPSIGPRAAAPAPTVDQAGLQAAVQAEQNRQQLASSGAQQNAQAGKTPEEWAAMVASGQTGVPAQESADDIRARLTPQFTNGGTAGVTGQAGANTLDSFGSLNQPFSQADFTADGAPKAPAFDLYGGAQDLTGFQDMPDFNPDMLKDDPGYQFRLDEGMKGVNNSAAAKGGLLSGAALKATDQYNQNYASGEYNNAFNQYQTTRGNKLQDFLTNRDTTQLNNTNALQTYSTNLGTQQANRSNALGDYTGAFDRFQTNRGNVINPLLSMMGFGQQATAGTSAAAQNYGQQATSAITGAGNAIAAGQVGAANAINGGIGSATNAFQQNQLMNLLLQRQPTAATSSAAGGAQLGSAFSGFQ